MFRWGSSSRLDRIEVTLEQLVDISVAVNRRINHFVETTQEQLQAHQQELAIAQQRTEQIQRAIEYRFSKNN